MPASKIIDLEPIPGYRLIEPLGKGGFGEVWKCEAPGGLFKAVKFVTGSEDDGLHQEISSAEQELRSFNLIKTIRHPFILSVDRVECVENELVIVMELADKSLHDVLESWQKAGQSGVPRGELLGYFREAAEALDVINLEYGLQHLDIKPRNLFLVHGHVKVADFGLVSSLADLSSGTLNLGAITPLYTAPESFVGKITLYSDQYSLAIAYHELLTGTFPFDGKNFRQLAMQHSAKPPDLSRLVEAERPIIARALAKNPGERFPSCTEFIEALQAIPSPPAPARPSRRVPVLRPANPAQTPAHLPLASRETKADRSAPPQSQTIPTERTSITGSAHPTPTAIRTTAVVPGYQFLECVGRSPTGEIWRALSAQGALRTVKLVTGCNAEDGLHPGGPLERLSTLDHPVLEEVEIVVSGQRLAIISEPIKSTLTDRLSECQKEGKAGIPRAELLGYLTEVADCLDTLAAEERLRHLALTPRALALTPDGVTIVDFGLAELIWLPGGLPPNGFNARYTPPELLAGQVAPTSDQYSLALIFIEMLTGVHPLRNANKRHPAAQKDCRPDLNLVPALDRAPLAQALSVDPDRRFPSCAAFIQALAAALPDVEIIRTSRSRAAMPVVAAPAAAQPQLNKLLDEVVARARGQFEERSIGAARYLLHPGLKLEHHCHARLLATAIKVQLHSFGKQWKAQLVSSEAHSHVFQVKTEESVWNRLRGRTTSLNLSLRFLPSEGGLIGSTPMLIEITPIGCSPERAAELLEEMAPKLLESVRSYFQVQPERRRQERLLFDHAVPVAAVLDNGRTGGRMTARAVNISTGGMRLRLPCQPPSSNLLIELSAPADPSAPVPLPARVVRTEACADGSYDVGVCFQLE